MAPKQNPLPGTSRSTGKRSNDNSKTYYSPLGPDVQALALCRFKDAMLAFGIHPPGGSLIPGKLYRLQTTGGTPRRKTGWCRLNEGGISGVFGDRRGNFFMPWNAEIKEWLPRSLVNSYYKNLSKKGGNSGNIFENIEVVSGFRAGTGRERNGNGNGEGQRDE